MRVSQRVWQLMLVAVLAVAAVSLALSTGAKATHLPANKAVAAGDKTVIFDAGTNVTLLTARMKTSKPTDLIISVSLECSIQTEMVLAGTDSARAIGTVRVWVELDGQIVPIKSVSEPPQDPPPPGDDTDKVVFCNRVHDRSVASDDFEQEVRHTLAANAFNWIRLNAGSGPHTIVVKADLVVSQTGTAVAHAIVQNRTLVVSPEKLANDIAI